MNDAKKPDQIDAAIAATEQPVAEQLEQVTVTISSTGRHFVIAFPTDATDSELLEFSGWIGNQLRLVLAQRRAAAPASRIVVARGALPS